MTDEHTDQAIEAPKPAKPKVDRFKWFRKPLNLFISIILLALIVCLIGHYSTVTIDWSRTKDFSDTLQNFVQIAAFFVAGWWAYFKFVKGRSFKESLVPAVSGRFVVIDDRTYLITTIRVKNVGQSIITFAPNASSLKLFGYSLSPAEEIITVPDDKITQFEALHENDKYIEPNEIIDETRFIAIPGSVVLGFRIELEIISSQGFTWRTTSVVEKTSSSGTIVTDETEGVSDG